MKIYERLAQYASQKHQNRVLLIYPEDRGRGQDVKEQFLFVRGEYYPVHREEEPANDIKVFADYSSSISSVCEALEISYEEYEMPAWLALDCEKIRSTDSCAALQKELKRFYTIWSVERQGDGAIITHRLTGRKFQTEYPIGVWGIREI